MIEQILLTVIAVIAVAYGIRDATINYESAKSVSIFELIGVAFVGIAVLAIIWK